MNSDLLSLLVMLSVALSCGCAVALGEYLYRALAQQPHGDGADGDSIVGDVVNLPSDLKISSFHERKE